MYWPMKDFLFAMHIQRPGEAETLTVFPKECSFSSLVELAIYLGKDFRPEWVNTSDDAVHREFHACGSADAFYHQSQQYLYHLIKYFMEGWKRPGYSLLFEVLTANHQQTVLDYGCGVGEDGLWFLANNVHISFADLDNPCSRFLRWRLDHRVETKTVALYNIETDAIPPHDIVWCTDVLEHLPPAEHLPLLVKLGLLGRCVIMNLVDDKGADGTVHHPVDVEGLTAWLVGHGAVVWRDYYGKPDGSKVRFLLYRLGEEVVS